MNLSRNDSRMLAMTIIYQIELCKKKKINYTKEELLTEYNEVMNDFAHELIDGVIEHEEELITIANQYLNNWNIGRLGLTDAAIIKIAIYELLYTTTPKKVVIDEAIELAKDYSDEKVVGMINGVLDKIYHNQNKEENK